MEVKTIRRNSLIVTFGSIFLLTLSIATAGVASAQTDIDIEVTTSENVNIRMQTVGSENIRLWVNNILVEEKFENMEEVDEYLDMKTNINHADILNLNDKMKNEISKIEDINDEQDDKLNYLKAYIEWEEGQRKKADRKLERRVKDYTDDEVQNVREEHGTDMASLESSFHDRIEGLKQRINEVETNQEFIVFCGMAILVIGMATLVIDGEVNGKES